MEHAVITLESNRWCIEVWADKYCDAVWGTWCSYLRAAFTMKTSSTARHGRRSPKSPRPPARGR
eukprot:CAMPEP_0198569956 /NCGR_PEP_ID=MMETSP1462-20131121/108462_1 /TAXON_ID=1333877 /ORGANISM="Brandtodinium nutriculum, Strain RCC3387" /LENGTH=63 /DNA_ID=CAMNT_0044301063 /DNA_START=361 /DNA_END=549 /DNA_ORIENTATION=+